jgi:hypothetical protein
LLTAAQQTSLRVSATEALSGSSRPALSEYEEAAAAPISPPKASVTTTASPAKSKPYGVAPDEAIVSGPAASPVSSTANVLIEFVPRSVTTSVRPSGLKAIWAGSASAASGRTEPSSGASESPASEKPAIPGVPLFSTYARSP